MQSERMNVKKILTLLKRTKDMKKTKMKSRQRKKRKKKRQR
jgi:hypothetical protein